MRDRRIRSNYYNTNNSNSIHSNNNNEKPSDIIKLNVLSKKQSIIYDGSEYDALDSLFSSLKSSSSSSSSSSSKSFKFRGDDDDDDGDDILKGNKMLITFITGTEENTGD